MYNLSDLFDNRSIVGARLEQILNEKNCTKVEVYKNTNVSRPTIDKILNGTITSKKTYENHIQKIMTYLNITPDMLLGNKSYGQNRIREIRNFMRISMDEMAVATGIKLERLQQIEAGEEATVAELRDIAMVMLVGTGVLTGKYFFSPQIGTLDYFSKSDLKGCAKELSGFWGHLGIKLIGFENYIWFPITGNTRNMIYRSIGDELLVVPCMNNKVLFFYMPNVQEITLLDEACDSPMGKDWDEEVSCGEVPLAFYEALEEYLFNEFVDENDEFDFSPRLKKCIDEYIKKEHLTEMDYEKLFEQSTIYYADGTQRKVIIDFDYDNTLLNKIAMVYGCGFAELENSFLYFTEKSDESERFINMKKISMIELPFLKLEESLCKREEYEDEL